jgi:NAD(P)-dependent dehydrogenase (short-subunit alcohol dehydrogenase family)
MSLLTVEIVRDATGRKKAYLYSEHTKERRMRELTGKVAVVTGAASGIGRAMAERFAREGMKIVLADIEEQPLGEAREAIAASGAEAIAVRTDVARWEQVEELQRRTFETFGTAHIVCNNAGVSVTGPTWQLSQADWEWILGVNLWSVIHGIRAFVPRLVDQKEGHVVNTASIAGLIAAPGMAAYAATKHGVVGISECLYHDLQFMAGGAVRVSVLCPAWVNTNIVDSKRNRPASLPGGNRERSQAEQMAETWSRAAVAAGIPPEAVAEKVISAIHEERFWVLTHPKSKKLVERRVSDIVEDRAPQFEVGQI